jgi:hypothetical protein
LQGKHLFQAFSRLKSDPQPIGIEQISGEFRYLVEQRNCRGISSGIVGEFVLSEAFAFGVLSDQGI